MSTDFFPHRHAQHDRAAAAITFWQQTLGDAELLRVARDKVVSLLSTVPLSDRQHSDIMAVGGSSAYEGEPLRDVVDRLDLSDAMVILVVLEHEYDLQRP